MNLQNSKEYRITIELAEALNDMCWSPLKFAECASTLHRTTQQTLMRSIVAIIKKFGSEDYGADLRNKATKRLCQDILASGILEKNPLPFV